MPTLQGKFNAHGVLERMHFYSTNAREKRYATALPGATATKDSDCTSLPPEPNTIDALQRHYGSQLFVEANLFQWLVLHRERAKFSIALQQQRDTDVLDTLIPWHAALYPYQRVGASWLYAIKRGILGDEVGLGKTLQALTAVRLLRAKRVLIVTLNSVKRSVWEHHCRTWLDQDVAICTGTHAQRQAVLDQHPDWVIINHEMLRPTSAKRNQKGTPTTLGYRGLVDRQWDAVIVDEAHKLQGRGTKSAQGRGAEMLHTDALFLLTGTPVWSDPESLWHLLRLLQPQRFSSYWRWIEEYFDTRETPWNREIVGVKPERWDDLQAIVAPVLLKRKKEDVGLQLPDKVRQTITWEPTPTQLRYYRTLKRERKMLAPRHVRYYDSAAATITDLRLLLGMPSFFSIPGDSPKDRVINELIETVPGKVIIFTWHVGYANYLAEHLRGQYDVALATGATAATNAVTFQTFRDDPNVKVLVGTIGAMGTATNDLLAANVAIFAEGSYVPTLNEQAEGRLHRIGQKTDVTIYRLQAAGTVEQAIWQQADERADLTNELLAFDELVKRVLEDDGGQSGDANHGVLAAQLGAASSPRLFN